jgi:outer membrane biosynthesis protein TonB
MSAPNSAKVLRVAVIVDGESCEELHQTEPADVSIIRGAETTLAASPSGVEAGIRADGTPAELMLPKILVAVGLLMLIVGAIWFGYEVDKNVTADAVLTKVDTEAVAAQETDASSTIALLMALLGVVPLMTGRTMLRGYRQRRKQQLTVYDGWARPQDYRKRAPIWLGIGVVVSLAGFGLFAYEVDRQAAPTEVEAAERNDMQAFKAAEQESSTGGLGLFVLLIGIVPLVVGVMGLSEDPVAPPKRAPKGGHAPRQHRLFEWVESEGSYYIHIPPETRGKIALGSNKATVEQLRKRFGQGDKLRIKLGNKAKGKLLIGQTRIMFQTAKPAAEAVKPPFPTEYIDPFTHLRINSLDAVAIGSAAAAAVILFVYFGYFADRTPPKPDERFVEVMGLPVSYEEEEEIVEEETEEENALTQKDENEKQDKKDEEQELDEKLTKPSNVSEAAYREARGVGVARVLGTYGGAGEGTVLDVIEGTENNLGELFAQGMSTTDYYQGGEIGEFVAGGGGINATGTVASNQGLQTGEGPAEVGTTEKKERKVKAMSTTDDVIGDVDKKSVSATIRRRMPGLEACYEKALRSNAGLKGKMTYTITINPSGRVTDVKIEEDTVGDASVRSCTEAKIKGWRFVSEGAEESSEVTFSVAFTG